MHLFMASNDEWVNQAAFHERRFFVVNVSDAQMQNHDYFGAITVEMQNGGRAALLACLQARAVTHDRIRQVPKTDELRIQQEHSMPPELKWWKERLEVGSLGTDGTWPEEVNVDQIHQEYVRWCSTMNINRRITMIDMSRRVLKPWLGAGRDIRVDGRQLRVRALLPLHEARKVFDAQAGTITPWEDGQVQAMPKEDLPF
jgi:hypothetical protein